MIRTLIAVLIAVVYLDWHFDCQIQRRGGGHVSVRDTLIGMLIAKEGAVRVEGAQRVLTDGTKKPPAS